MTGGSAQFVHNATQHLISLSVAFLRNGFALAPVSGYLLGPLSKLNRFLVDYGQ